MRDITVSGLQKRFGEKRVLEDFSAVFPAGQVTCVMGPSGCGKTTLLNILLGLEKADGGSVTGIPDRISAVFQEERLCEDFSAVTNVRMVTGKAVKPEEIEACLRALGLEGSLYSPVRELSGGMKRRVAIARALLAEGELLILDEPFKGLDEGTREAVVEEMKNHILDRTVIMVTHDPQEAALMGADILEMRTLQ